MNPERLGVYGSARWYCVWWECYTWFCVLAGASVGTQEFDEKNHCFAANPHTHSKLKYGQRLLDLCARVVGQRRWAWGIGRDLQSTWRLSEIPPCTWRQVRAWGTLAAAGRTANRTPHLGARPNTIDARINQPSIFKNHTQAPMQVGTPIAPTGSIPLPSPPLALPSSLRQRSSLRRAKRLRAAQRTGSTRAPRQRHHEYGPLQQTDTGRPIDARRK